LPSPHPAPVKTANNNPAPTPPTNQPKSDKNQDLKNEAGKLLEVVKELEKIDKKNVKHFNKKLVENLNQLKQAQANNTRAYQIVNGQKQRIDKILQQFQHLEKQEFKKPEPINYAP
jgi:small-conductance mechanosensitive channel